jgi:hypothetical protein
VTVTNLATGSLNSQLNFKTSPHFILLVEFKRPYQDCRISVSVTFSTAVTLVFFAKKPQQRRL